ncbi:hypothetical protein [Flavobacterium sp.]
MSIARRLPNTDATRSKALTKAKFKNDSIPVANQFLTTPTITRLDDTQPVLKVAMQRRGTALAEQVDATSEVSQSFLKSRMYISHFFQGFNMGIARGIYMAANRAYYQLDASSDSVPAMHSHQDVAYWGENIETGDAARIAAGGVAMASPTAAEVKAAVDSFNTKNTDQSILKDNYDSKQEAVSALHEEADKVIKKVWDEVETFYNEEENSSRRRKCREWGVVYVSDVEHTFNCTVVDAVTNEGIDTAVIVLLETGNTGTTSNGGRAVLKSTIVDEATFRFTHPGFQAIDMVVPMPTGVTSFDVKAMMEKL